MQLQALHFSILVVFTDKAISSLIISAFETILDLATNVSMSSWNNCFTTVVSASNLLKNAAASNVRTPVLKEKFLVSTVIPANSASASFFSS